MTRRSLRSELNFVASSSGVNCTAFPVEGSVVGFVAVIPRMSLIWGSECFTAGHFSESSLSQAGPCRQSTSAASASKETPRVSISAGLVSPGQYRQLHSEVIDRISVTRFFTKTSKLASARCNHPRTMLASVQRKHSALSFRSPQVSTIYYNSLLPVNAPISSILGKDRALSGAILDLATIRGLARLHFASSTRRYTCTSSVRFCACVVENV